MKQILFPAIAASLALTACAPAAEPATQMPAQRTATANLLDRQGQPVGTVTITEAGGMLHVSLTGHGLPPGAHGAHIHAVGDCSAADFTSAGGHWNPGNTMHGSITGAPHPHAGDLQNLVIADDGTGTLEGTSTGPFDGLFDADGSAFVIHAAPDDYLSQPSGNAGARIACGVFARG